jgi:putative ABC transport system ATP-binding protein
VTLQVKDVSLVLGDGDQRITALDHVNLEVAAGQLLAVVGPSGSGKSSLLAVVGGLRRPSSGQIRIDGADLTDLSAEALTTLRRDRIGFVFQQSNLVPSLTALDQLLLTVHLRGRNPGAADRDKARALLNDVGMGHRENNRPAGLSGGERQRVGIARALMSDPAIMLVDEPTSMLDHGRGQQVIELLARECHQRRVATLMVTHDPAMLDSADRVVTIIDGRLTDATGAGHATH